MSRYTIAVRYEFGSAAARKAKGVEVRELLEKTEGVSFVGDKGMPVILIETTPEIIENLRKTLGDSVWIEEPIRHYPASNPPPPAVP